MKIEILNKDHYKALYEVSKVAEPWQPIQYYQFEDILKKREGYVLISAIGEVVGVISFSDYAPDLNIIIHCMVHPKYQKRWASRELLKKIADYVFGDLGLPKITSYSMIGLTDEAGGFLDLLGFVREGCIRRGVRVKGEYYDVPLYGMLKEECKWR